MLARTCDIDSGWPGTVSTTCVSTLSVVSCPSTTRWTDADGTAQVVGHRTPSPGALRRTPCTGRRRSSRSSARGTPCCCVLGSRQPIRSSEDVPHAEFERVGLRVLVPRQDPRHPIAFVVLEQDDLIVDRSCRGCAKTSGRRGRRCACRSSAAPSGSAATVWLAVRIDERRRQLKRVDAEGLLDDLPDLRRQRAASACVARAVRMSVCAWFGFCSARSSARRPGLRGARR